MPLFLEAFFVVLGVVLALGANEWREQINNARHADRALEGIQEELRANQAAVTSALHYHLHLADTLRYFIPRAEGTPPAQRPDNRLFSRGFVSPATVLSTAWDVANVTDAVGYMDYNDVLLLSRTYASQQSYEHQAEQVGQLIYTRLFDEGHQGIYGNLANLQDIIATFWYRECQLLASYDEAFTHFGQAPPAIPSACRRSVAACLCAKNARTARLHIWAKSSEGLPA
ncbi:MAG TPA: hypothetical protein VKP65_02270 [Rhodothermales bacterium]|nr:hypothetical protein [Rhodothermales bacterium]